MRMRLASLFCIVLLLALAPVSGAVQRPLPRATPESQGVSSAAVADFIAALDAVNTPHSVMVVRHGKVIAQAWWKPEAADKPHVLWSLTKSFTSTAVGLAIAEGKLNLDDKVLKFFPDDAPAEVSENLKALTVKDLLTMSGGHETEPREVDGNPSVKIFLAHPFTRKPGEHFQYNTMGSYVLSAIVTKVTGQTEADYLKPRLFEPLGIDTPTWKTSAEGVSVGGYGLSLQTEDLAKFGLLYLNKGQWEGKALLPAAYVAAATSKQIDNDRESHNKLGIDWRQGYGFQFWQCTHESFRGDGAGGQLCVMIPQKEMVVAITADTGSFQAEMNAIWEKLYPACGDKPLAEDAAAQTKVAEAVSKLEAHPAKKAK